MIKRKTEGRRGEGRGTRQVGNGEENKGRESRREDTWLRFRCLPHFQLCLSVAVCQRRDLCSQLCHDVRRVEKN